MNLDTFGEGYEFIIGALGAAVAILSGMLGFFKFQEKWINYRTTSEQLKKEKYLYETGTEPYNQAGKSFNLLVKNCEALISGENTEWNNYIRTEDQEE